MRIGVIGSGEVAQTLASGFLSHGHEVTIGTRDPSKLECRIRQSLPCTVNEVKVGAPDAIKTGRRERLLTLTPAGNITVARLNEQSALQIQGLLANVNSTDLDALLDSLSKVRSILSEPTGRSVRIIRLSKFNDDAIRLLQEYYEAVSVVQRDTPEAIQNIIDDPGSGMWLAYLEEMPVGCVVLRKLGSVPSAGECKRLYVQPIARGHGIADKLLDAQEEFARSKGLRWIYLDSYDDLKVAIALYRKRGYVSCERFNDNPQATVFLRKSIALRP